MARRAYEKGAVERLLLDQPSVDVKRYPGASVGSLDAPAKSVTNHGRPEESRDSLHPHISSKHAGHLLQQHSWPKTDKAWQIQCRNKKVCSRISDSVRNQPLPAVSLATRIELALQSCGRTDRADRASESAQHWYRQKKQRCSARSSVWRLHSTAISACQLAQECTQILPSHASLRFQCIWLPRVEACHLGCRLWLRTLWRST